MPHTARVRESLLALVLAIGVALSIAPAATAAFDDTEVSAPGSGAPLYLTKNGWQWEDLSSTVPDVTYNVYRGGPAEPFRCIASNLDDSLWTGDPEVVPRSTLWWYSVNADDTWSENRRGSSLPRDAPCPCSGPAPVAGTGFRLELFTTISGGPVTLVSEPGNRARTFVATRVGNISIVERGVVLWPYFLELGPKVSLINTSGLLSMVFHPDYENNGRLFVFYITDPGLDVAIEEYTVSATDPNLADPASARRLLTAERGADQNHTGGAMEFGDDGYLYFSIGSNALDETSQDIDTFNGKIHRIDVDSGTPYGIPPDNPFVGIPGAVEEIWALGTRQPWRFTFDRDNGDLYFGDVGGSGPEEISVLPGTSAGGDNFGFDIYEASRCRSSPCDPTGLTPPTVEYAHDEGCAVIGGYVYRGCRMPDLSGTYFYSDFCGVGAGFLRSFVLAGGVATDEQNHDTVTPYDGWSSFGQDEQGELFILNHRNSTIWKMLPDP